MRPLYRHDIVYLEKQASFNLLSCDEKYTSILKDWIEDGLPLITTRQDSKQDGVRLALAVVINGQKVKSVIHVSEKYVVKVDSLPSLERIFAYYKWDLKHLGGDVLQVFGSFAISFLSGRSFYTTDSDLDVLIHYDNQSLKHLQEVIFMLEASSGHHVDAEVRFDGYGDVKFSELLQSRTKDLLFKTITTVSMIPKRSFYEQFSALSSY